MISFAEVTHKLNSLIGKNIKVFSDAYSEKTFDGILLRVTSNGYYAELLLQVKKYRKNILLFYPFHSEVSNDRITLSYNASYLSEKSVFVKNAIDNNEDKPYNVFGHDVIITF